MFSKVSLSQFSLCLSIIFAALGLGACDKLVNQTPAPSLVIEQKSELFLPEGRWILIQKGEQRFSAESQPQLRIQASDISGNDGCNQFTGSYALVGNRFSAQVVSTEKLCNDAQGELSNRFQQLLTGCYFALNGADVVFSLEDENWVFRQQSDLVTASDRQGHGPDAGSIESISALIWQGKVGAAVIEAFWLAAKDGEPVPLSTIKLTDTAKGYLTNERSAEGSPHKSPSAQPYFLSCWAKIMPAASSSCVLTS
ncbi:META domain-containing protein [Motilimonas cestriensis]|uniref:META domain-containing protein n=1 Tax=Motilimonas cestriensis TaxID=2742685 RepID=A0ABS8WI30_9GAMM|nr:META domain-containing protein [Motilimonas cestriensis]